MKYILHFFIIVFSFNSIAAQQVFTMQEAMQYADENAFQVEKSRLKIADAQQQIRETTSIGLPQINGSFNYTYNYKIPQLVIPDFSDPSKTQTLSFGLPQNATLDVNMQTLLLDGQYIFGLRAARVFKDLVAAENELSERDVRYQVAQAYIAVWLMDQNLNIVESNIKNLEASLSETKEIYNNGFAEQLDVDRLELSVSNLENERDNLNRMKELSLNRLKFLMNFPLEEELIVQDDFNVRIDQVRVKDINLEEEPSFSERPEFLTFEKSTLINEINVKRLKAGYYPSLVGFAGYSANLSRNELFDSQEPGFLGAGIMGVQLNVPIFDGFLKSAQIQRAQLDLDEIQLNQEEFTQATRLEARNARIQLYNAKENLNNRLKTLELAQKIYDITQIKYQEGVGSSLETSQAERELYQAQSQVIQAKYDLLKSKIDLDKATGKI